MAKDKKLKFKKVKKAKFVFDIDMEEGGEQEHEFEFTQLSTGELQELADDGISLISQHNALRDNTKCITEGLSEDEADAVLEKLFEDIWNLTEPGSWLGQMNELLGNDKKKK